MVVRVLESETIQIANDNHSHERQRQFPFVSQAHATLSQHEDRANVLEPRMTSVIETYDCVTDPTRMIADCPAKMLRSTISFSHFQFGPASGKSADQASASIFCDKPTLRPALAIGAEEGEHFIEQINQAEREVRTIERHRALHLNRPRVGDSANHASKVCIMYNVEPVEK
jgi:hypothetical protein